MLPCKGASPSTALFALQKQPMQFGGVEDCDFKHTHDDTPDFKQGGDERYTKGLPLNPVSVHCTLYNTLQSFPTRKMQPMQIRQIRQSEGETNCDF